MSSLLPPNTTHAEHALDDSTARLATPPVEIPKLWQSQNCPITFLPWLAWTVSSDEWLDEWTASQKRAVIAASYQVHAHKGTPYAILSALQALGYEFATVRESNGTDLKWPLFDVNLNIGSAPAPALVDKIKNTINRYKNARSVLNGLYYMSYLYDNTIIYNGAYNHSGGNL